MKEFFSKIDLREIVLLFAVGAACLFYGDNRGLRQQDSRVITVLGQRNKELTDVNKKIVKVLIFAIKQDTTGAVEDEVKNLGLK